jgi:hypothetical protein
MQSKVKKALYTEPHLKRVGSISDLTLTGQSAIAGDAKEGTVDSPGQ